MESRGKRNGNGATSRIGVRFGTMRSFRAAALVALVALGIAACSNKKKPQTDALPIDAVSMDDLVREQKRVEAGETVGQALVVPKIELDYRGVTVNGTLVVGPSELDSTKLARVEKLHAWLRGLREHWKTIHPARAFGGLIELDAAPEADALAGESVIETAAAAGYPRVRLKIEEVAWDATLTVPLPPGADDAPERKPDVRLRLRRALVGWDIDALANGPCDARPTVKTRVVKSEALAALVDELCPAAERCLLSVEASTGALLTVAKLVAPAFGAGRPTNVSLDLFPGEGVSAAPDGGAVGGSFAYSWIGGARQDDPFAWADRSPDASLPDGSTPPKKPPRVATGSVEVNGRLAPNAVESVVRAKLDGVRACYEDELRRTPALTGRVTVKLAIDSSGAVAQACSVGSDLPNASVVACVVRATSRLSFPAPAAGAVVAVVPFLLSTP